MALGPLISKAQVIAHDTNGHGVQIITDAGHGPGLPVKILTAGGSDGWRVQQEPLPEVGTWGLVIFPYGDNRGGVWLGSYATNLVDAFTTGPSSSPFDRYHAHWAGGYSYMDGASGTTAQMWPDGTSVVVNASGTVPTQYAHRVDDKQTQQRVPITQLQRRPAGPTAPNVVKLSHPSGTSATIDASGNITEMQLAGTMTLSVSGIGQIVISGSGITMSAASLIHLGGFAEAVNRLIDTRGMQTYNVHTHPLPDGTSGPPNQQMSIGNHTTTVTFAG